MKAVLRIYPAILQRYKLAKKIYVSNQLTDNELLEKTYKTTITVPKGGFDDRNDNRI